jgi:hypothetical protein
MRPPSRSSRTCVNLRRRDVGVLPGGAYGEGRHRSEMAREAWRRTCGDTFTRNAGARRTISDRGTYSECPSGLSAGKRKAKPPAASSPRRGRRRRSVQRGVSGTIRSFLPAAATVSSPAVRDGRCRMSQLGARRPSRKGVRGRRGETAASRRAGLKSVEASAPRAMPRRSTSLRSGFLRARPARPLDEPVGSSVRCPSA